MRTTKLQRLLVTPGVWLVSRRLRVLAGVYFSLVGPIVSRL